MNDPDPPKPYRTYRPLEQDHKQHALEQSAKDAKWRVAEAKVRAAIEAQREGPSKARATDPEAARHEQRYRPRLAHPAPPGLGPSPGGAGRTGAGVYRAPGAPAPPEPETMKGFSDRLQRESKVPPPKAGREVTDAQRERQAKDKYRVAVERVARSMEKVNANDGNTKDTGKGGRDQ